MEAKKRAKGIKIEVKLTKKQQEAKDAELAKESAIRKRLEKVIIMQLKLVWTGMNRSEHVVRGYQAEVP